MISFIETILGTVLSSFVVVIIATFLALLIDFLFPSFSKWTRMMLIFIVITVVLQPAFAHLTLIRDIAHNISMMFISIYPILTASMIAAGGAFSMLNFQPAMLLVRKRSHCFGGKLSDSAFDRPQSFLILVTRILPSVPFTKMADLIRTTLLGTVSAVVAAYSIFITVGGTMSWALSGFASEPIKELIRQNVPTDWLIYD